MRFLPIVFFLLNLAVARAGDSNEKLYDIASNASFDHGRLTLMFYAGTRIWLNGVQIDTETFGRSRSMAGRDPEAGRCSDDREWMLFLRPPAVSRRTFDQYRLDRLTSDRAWFTRSIFTVISESLGEGKVEYRPGALKAIDHFQVTGYGLLYEPLLPGVVVGGKTSRTK